MTRKPKPPVKVRATLRLDAYTLIRDRLEGEALDEAFMGELCEVVRFDEVER